MLLSPLFCFSFLTTNAASPKHLPIGTKKEGKMARITLPDIALREHTLESLPRLRELRELSFARRPAICIERARHVTRYLKDVDQATDTPEVRQAKKVRYFLERKSACFHDRNLLAGSTTSKELGAPLFPEYFALTLWPELLTVSERKKNPQKLSLEDARELNFDIFPFWMERNVLEQARKRISDPTGLNLFESLVFFIAGKAGCISHCVPSYVAMLEKGLDGIIAEAAGHEKECRQAAGDEERRKADFYQAMGIALEGVKAYAANLAAEAERLAARAGDPTRKNELAELAAVCRRVPAQPARTFREAINAIWLCQVGIHAENINMAMSPGRLDQLLYPYYRRDIEAGRLTVAAALELVGCLWLKLADNVAMVPEASEELFGGAGTVPAITLGGVDTQGEDAVNDLTYVMLRATELLQIRDPNVNARYHYEKNPPAYSQRVAEVIINTRAVPAFFNDAVNIDALVGQGEALEHARDYAVIGCVELASNGRDYPASSSIILNLVAPLEMALHGGRRLISGDHQIGPRTPEPAQLKSFEQFWEVFKTQLDWLIGRAIDLNEHFGAVHQEMMPSPLLSALFEGPMQKGADLIRGGARYNSSGATHIGFADVVDSLSAIEQLVWTEGKFSFAGLREALDNDFAGDAGEKMRLFLKNHTPRYGTEHPVARKNAKNLIRHLFEVYQGHTNYRGGRYRPAYWTMTNHAGLGALAGAMPHGRKSGELLASGITPVSGAAPELTACLNAVADLGGREVPGCWAFNMKYTPEADQEAMRDRFAQTVAAYFRAGGQQVQFNLMTYAMLLDAKAHPDKYPELMVRVSGYSAYFKDLNEMMRNELISRSQYTLSTGAAVPFPGLPADGKKAEPGGQTIGDWLRKALSRLLLFTPANRPWRDFDKCLKSEVAEEFLQLLLRLMELTFAVNPAFRKNIEGFAGRYLFKSADGEVTMAAIFKDGTMEVREALIDNADITVTFRNGRTLLNLILSPRQDILGSMLRQDVKTEGNLNYLYRFGAMAKQLQLMMPRI
jgi:formate C-acetyltransferase